MTTAIFSNGHTDTYKGNRPVKAAWAIICNADGKVLMSGHSLDRAKAQNTAHSNAASCWSITTSSGWPRCAATASATSNLSATPPAAAAGTATASPASSSKRKTLAGLANAPNSTRSK